MRHKYVYVVTITTNDSEANADIKVFDDRTLADKYYQDNYYFCIRVYNYKHIYTRKIATDSQYDISTTIVLRNGNKVTMKLAKIYISK